MGGHREGKQVVWASPQTALGVRGVVMRKKGGPDDLGLLEGPKKEARLGGGRVRTYYSDTKAQSCEATEAAVPWRNTMVGHRRTKKRQDLKSAVVATTVFKMDRSRWGEEKAA